MGTHISERDYSESKAIKQEVYNLLDEDTFCRINNSKFKENEVLKKKLIKTKVKNVVLKNKLKEIKVKQDSGIERKPLISSKNLDMYHYKSNRNDTCANCNLLSKEIMELKINLKQKENEMKRKTNE